MGNNTDVKSEKSHKSLHNRPAALLFILIITLTLDPRPTALPRRGRRRPPHGDVLPEQLADAAGAVHAVEGVADGGRDGGEAGAAAVGAGGHLPPARAHVVLAGDATAAEDPARGGQHVRRLVARLDGHHVIHAADRHLFLKDSVC